MARQLFVFNANIAFADRCEFTPSVIIRPRAAARTCFATPA